ncbi:hypothetical protein DXB99_15465 [Agathobacter rectalis]|uniref:Uncharacterized protein n=1 Tax=Agathobacter rectalis TaxID=39491 RepID=A0A3E4Y4N2_9FIRM|nr:hypothetical protein DXB99_15465 [Agathobacter rectalis]
MLSTPPAFILSQDQTLMFEFFSLQLCCLVKTNFVLLSEVFSSLVKGSILVKLNLANSFIQINLNLLF